MPQAQTYQSEFTGLEMDARFTAVAQLTAALEALTAVVAQKYVKPASGIPSTDMDADVQAALAKANTAVQSLADYYTKSEVDQLLAAINGMEYVDVAALPTASASTMGKIYLVGPDASGYYAYYYTSYDGSAYSWVGPLGTTQISLANYATKAELSQLDQTVTGNDNYSFSASTGEHSANNDKHNIDYKAGTVLKGTISLGTAQWNGASLSVALKNAQGTNVVYKSISMGTQFEITGSADAATISFYIYNITTAGTFLVSLTYGGMEKEIADIEDDIADLSNAIDGISKTDTIRVNGLFGYLKHDFNPTAISDKAVSSVNGDFVAVNGQKSVEIDLTGLPYTHLQFKTTSYGGNYGYGFFVNGVWQGTKTTSNAEVTIEIPSGATIFRACWNATNLPSNYYRGVAENDSLGADDIYYNKEKVAVLEEEVGNISGSNLNTLLSLVERNNVGSQFDFTKVGVYDYYAAFDELAYTYKNDFTIGTNIGTSTTPSGTRATKDSNTYPIKRYTFKKAGTTPTKTIILCGAIHGDSQSVEDNVVYNNNGEWYNDGGDAPQNILCALFFLQDFLENHTKNALYKNLYDNYCIEVVPILNPWGVQNHSRANGRNVDIARNFDYNWTEGTTSYGHSTGTAAFSESESAAFRDFVNALSGVELCVECHARGDILIPSSVQFLSVIPETADALQSKVTSIMSTYITSRFSGSYSGQRSDTPSLVNWMQNVKEIDSVEPEFAQTFAENIYTRNTRLVNYQMSEMLRELITRLI